MEESTAPVAATSEATPTTNQVSEPAVEKKQETVTAPTADIPTDQIEAFNKFVNANGGFEKAFAKLKSDVSTKAQPAQQPVQQPEQQAQTQVTQMSQPTHPEQVPAGYITEEEFRAQQYFQSLASEPGYENISDKIRSGAVLSEMAKFGIKPMQDHMINDRQVRDFLSLYAKTVPTQAPSSPITTTPTVDYINVGDQVTSRDDAIAIINQNRTLKNGMAPHPQTEAAKEYLKKYFNGEVKK